MILEGFGPVIATSRAVLDIAPIPQISKVLRRISPFIVRMDLDPAADRRHVDVQASLCQGPFRDGTFDAIICYHVLEHVPDDAAAMSELARLLSAGGFALIQVPWRPGTTTDEDPTADFQERVRRFGQANHVRYYGTDFDDRLHSAGLESFRFTVKEVLPPELIDFLRLITTESVWLVRRAIRAPRALSPIPGALQLALGRLATDLLLRDRYHTRQIAKTQ
jgi:SAM-dependent methyltransferase